MIFRRLRRKGWSGSESTCMSEGRPGAELPPANRKIAGFERAGVPLATGDRRCKCCAGPVKLLGSKDGFDFWECLQCRFVFTDGVQHQEMVEKYRTGYHGTLEGAPEEGWAMAGAFLQPAFALLSGQLRILDFGCGQSCLPSLLRQQGHEVWGVDVTPPLRPGPQRLTGDIVEMDLSLGAFDLIYSFQVFEHLAEPRPVVRKLWELLAKDGLLLIHTDMEVKDREAGFLQWWYVLPPDHCSFYRHQTFERLMEDQPHEIVLKDEKMIILRKGCREWTRPAI